ncbi:MAG TPA: amino acid adenylation domain-containing protein, partial [Longimicrobium sp.]|nr:amino acid adenylation domain-containing protein [Longimicrobium sp.]
GFFLNTLALRTRLGGDPGFREVLRRVREATLGAYEHQDVPFERLVEALQPERSLSHSPLFQVMFVLHDPDRPGSALPGLEVQRLSTASATSKFDLTLALSARPEGLVGALDYSTDLFDAATIQRMLGHFARVLEQIADDADVPLSALELFGADERRRVLLDWNATDEAYPAGACIHTLFEAQAARTPDAVAVTAGDESLAYAQLNQRANRLAHHLAGLGVGPEVRVGIGMERGVEMVAAMLAVLKAGGAYVPLDPAYPADRLAFTARDSSVAVLITQETVRGKLPVQPGVRVVSIDGDAADRIAAEDAANLVGRAAPRSLAYLIYTSGSTGVPKGVAIEHQSAVALLSWAAGVYTADEMSGVLAATSISFDLSIYEIFLPLSLGGRVIVAENALALASIPARDEVRLINTVPSAIAALLKNDAIPAGVKTVNLAGEPLRAELVDAIYARGGVERVYDLYGPSEDTTYSTYTLRTAGGPETIGRPISNTRAYVLDAGLRPVPTGVIGELYLAGRGLARGYLGRPGLTAEKFIPNHLGNEAGGRLYRTGDKVRWLADGTLEYLGRLDAQVKVRGYRIELGEIESVLRVHSAVADCVTLVREDVPGDKRLVAYVVGNVDADTLRHHLRRSVPEYMVPSAFVMLAGLPLTPNGKVDRKALPAPEHAQAEDGYVAPRTPVEEVLAEIWAEVLRVERVGAGDGFFDLGGHSLLATRVVSRIREALGVELPLRALFEAPTVAELAGRVEALRRAGMAVLPAIVPVERTRPLPLSFAQERLWFLDRLEPGSASYNVPTPLRITGALDAAVLERALGEIIRRHEALRTVFAEVNGAPVQVVVPFAGFTLPVEDLSWLDDGDREAAIQRRATEEAARPFGLATGPLFRAALLRIRADDHVLLLTIHHIVSDAWSLGVLFRELSALYAAFMEGADSPLADLPVQFADFAAWQRNALRGEALEGQLAWWQERLAGAPALLELPTDRPRPAVQTYHGAYEVIRMPGELLGQLQALGRGEGATLFMVLLGAWQILLSRYSGSDDIVVGTPIAGRARREVEEVIGFFLNTLAVRTELGGDPTFRDVLKRVREATLGAYEHQEIPFERLVEALQPERSLSHSPLFQVMFVLQEADRQRAGLPGMQVRGIATESGTAKFDLTLALAANEGGLAGTLEYSTDLFDRATIQRMLAHLERLLRHIARAPETPVSQLELLGDGERRLMLEEWNRADPADAAQPCAHQLVEARADRTPDAVAVTHGDVSLSYRELDERANRLANHLIGLGVRVDDRVGLSLERGAEMMVAVLGILKAGAAYVPLDPAYPADRLAYMLQNSAAPVIVTQEGVAEKLPAGDVTVVRVDADAAEIAGRSAERPRLPVAAENLAYVIYTSGSTGRPKGVAMTHGALANLLDWQEDDWRTAAPAVTLQFTSISFDVSFQEIFSCWAGGGRLVLIDEEQRYDPAALLEVAEREGVERIFMPAVALHQLAEAGDARGIAPKSLREVITAGEQLRVTEPMRRWFAALGAPLYNHYGPSETHVVTSLALDGDAPAWPLLPSIGAPIARTQTYVLDAAANPSPVGVPGELFLGGAGLARGYLDRPALTAERFVPDPFSTTPGARVYRTGDRARWLANGTLEFLGRADEQVKIRGFRIEPGEVEAVLATYPRVRKAVVIAREDVPGDRRLVAYVVADEAADAAELRAHLKGRLPEYMVPSAFVVLDALPLTPSGKVARRALPAPEYAAAEDRYVAPGTPVEEVLAAIWAEVLRVDRVGVRESFFELGGHSLLAVRVVSRVRAALNVELPLRTLFESPTVAELAAAVEALRGEGATLLPPVVPVERTDAMPLSFAQERLWFLDRLQPGGAIYNLPAAARLRGDLNVAALERALGEIVRRHEVLRTTFREMGGTAGQVIAPFGGFTLAVEDLSALADAEREAAVARRSGEESARPFDLARGPLFRATLLRLEDDEHVLLLAMHHIVSDGWSLRVLFRELGALYAAYAEGAESPLADLPVQYADYAAWQRQVLRGEVLDRQVAWWKERLSGAPALLELPTDRPRPAVQSYRGAYESTRFSGDVLEGLHALARGEGATLYMVLLAAFQVLLGKYSGGDDVVVGSPVAGRNRGEVEGLIGFFVNTLALRTGLSGDPAFRDVLRRVRAATLGAYEHQEVPFERLVEELQPERSLSYSPLFQVLFVLQDSDGESGGTLPGLEMRGVSADTATSKFDLTFALAARPGGLSGTLEYSTDLFDAAAIQRMLAHFGRVLEQIAAAPERRLSELDLLDDAERSHVLQTLGSPAATFAADETLHGRFARQAALTPGRAAVTFDGETLSYAELDRRSNQLAHWLRGRGVGPEVRVGLCLERGPEMIVCILGVLKAGGAYVPLDPAYPADRLAYTLEDAGIRVVLSHSSVADRLTGEAEIVALDAEWERIAGEDDSALPESAVPESLAYVIYTSGSTGKPKGVQVTHGNVARLFTSTDADFGFGADDVWTLFHSYAFDFSVWEIWGALLYGGRLVIVPHLVTRSPEEFHALLVREGVTVLNQTPSAFRQLIAAEEALGASPELALRYVVFGGEALEPGALRGWVARHGIESPRLVNMYGITETTVHVTYRPLTPEDVEHGSASPIGRAIPDLGVYVLDPRGNALPVGVPGEMYVAGAGVARGYLGRPALTAQRFVPDPFSDKPGARLYRSGDKARWLASGELEYLGRLDEQVKIRGFRIELGEIEAVLRSHTSVRDCAVIVREDVPGDTRLVAYVVGAADAESLRGHLRQSLPEYMVPAAFVAMDGLPLTSNGKLDRRALPAPEYTAADDEYVAPQTPVEEALAAIWAEVLRLERVGVRENFFERGGHSLLVIRVVSRIREALSVELPLRALFEAPTIGDLAVVVESLRQDGARMLPPIVPVERSRPLPLSFAQERLWFLDRLEPGSASYNIPAALRLAGALDAAAMERALGEIVHRHEALRTVFREAGDGAVQVIAPFAGFALPVEDLSALDESAREAAVQARAAEEAARPFDLSAGPLFRANLLRLGADEHVLLLCMHHIVADAWSLGVLFRELSALYAAYRDGAEAALPDLPVQYADYAAWQRNVLQGAVLDRQLAWWKGRLAGAPALLELPTDRPRPAMQSYRGAYERVELPAGLLERLQNVAHGEGATLFMVVLGAFQVLLVKYSGSNDIVVGSPIAGRTRGEVENLIGFFLNTLALRADLSANPSFRDVLKQVREATLGAYENQDVPFERLVEELQPERSLSHSPLFQVMFVLQEADRPSAGLPGLQLRGVGAETATSKFDLTLSLGTRSGAITGALEYSTDLFDASTIQRMIGHFARVLEQIANDVDVLLDALELFGADERRRVLLEWNATDEAYPADACIHTLFEAQAARTPDAVAVTAGDDSLTYTELNERANRLAHHLAGLGVGPEVRVGIGMERGLEMVAAMLAVLKAGGAYVPLDPAYPADRLAFTVKDSSVAVVVTQQAVREKLPLHAGVRVVSVDGDADRIAAEDAANLAGRAAPRSLAYLIYTSGSTGVPKGVAIEHQSAVALLSWAAGVYTAEEMSGVLAATSISFDLSIYEIFLPLSLGGRVIVAENALALANAPARDDV